MKKKIIFLFIFILVLIIGGAAIYYFTQSNSAPITYADEEAKYKTYTEEAPNDGSTPTDHDSYANIAYVLWVLEHTEHFSSLTTGNAVSVGQKQEIYNLRRVDGDVQLVDTVSSGVVPVGYQKYFEDGKVLLRKYVSKNGNDFVWSDETPECITYKGYIGRYGWLPTQATAYIICKDTILEISETKDLGNGLYSIKLSLNPDENYAPFWYRREVATNSSSLDRVTFSSINLEYVFDENWVVRSVATQESYHVRPKVAPIPVDCTTDLTEVFDYENYSFPKEAMQFFDQFKDLTPSDGTVETPDEETALGYITGSLMGGNKEKTFDLNLIVEEKEIKGKLALDINDLNNIKVKVAIDKLQIIYENGEVFIELNETKIKTKVADITEMLAPLLSLFTSNGVSSDLSSGLDVAAILNDINNAEILESDNSVTLKMTLNLLGIELPLVFNIQKDGKNYDLLSINSNLNIEGIKIDVNLSKNENITFNQITDDYQELTDIDFIIDDIVNILSNRIVKVNFSGKYETIELEGSIIIDFVNDVKVSLDLVFTEKEKNISDRINLIYANETIYLSYHNSNVKVPVSLFKDLLGDVNIDFESLDVKELINTLLDFDYAKLLTKLSISKDQVELVTDLSEFIENIEIIKVLITNNENGFDVSVNYFDLELSIITMDVEHVEIEEDKYALIDVYKEFITYLVELVGKESIEFDFDGTLNYEGYQLGFNGTIYLVLVDNQYQVEGNITLNYAEYSLDVKVYYVEKEIYISILGQNIKLNAETLDETLNEILAKLSIELPKTEISLDFNTLMSFIDSITIKDDQIDFDLSGLSDLLTQVTIKFGKELGSFNISVSDIMSLDLKIKPSSKDSVTLPTENIIDEALILDVLDYVLDIMEIIDNKHLSLDVNVSYEGLSINGNVYVDFQSGIKVKADLTIKYDELSETIIVYYIDGDIYLEYRNVKVKTTVLEIQSLLAHYELLPEVPQINFEDLLTADFISNIEKILSTLKIEKDSISLTINDLTINLKDTSVGFDLLVDNYDLNLSVDIFKEDIIDVDSTEYSSVTNYIELIEYLTDLINKESIELEVSGTTSYEGYLVGYTGTIDLVLVNGNYQAEGNITLSYGEYSFNLKLYYVNEEIYVTLYGQTIKLNLKTIDSTISEIVNILGLNMPKIDFSVSLETIIEIIDSLTLTSNAINVDLTKLFDLVGLVNIKLNEQIGDFDLEIGNLVSLNVKVKKSLKEEVNLPTENIIDETQILEVLKYVVDVMEIMENKHLNLGVDVSYAGVSVTGDVYIDFQVGLKVKADLTISYGDLTENLVVYYLDGDIYLEYRNVKVKCTLDDILTIVDNYIELPNFEEFNLDELLSKLFNLDIESMIESLAIKDNSINLVLSVLELGLIDIKLVNTANGFDIEIDKYNLGLVLDLTSIKEISIDKDLYTDGANILNVVNFVLGLVNKESILVDIKEESKAIVKVKFNDKIETIELFGIVELLLIDGKYSVKADLTVEGFGLLLKPTIILNDNIIYITISNQTIYLPIENLADLVSNVLTKLVPIIGTDIEVPQITFDLNLDFLDTLVLGKNSLSVSIVDILTDVLTLNIIYELLVDTQELDINLNGSYGELVEFDLNDVIVSKTLNNSLTLPRENLITDEEILNVLDYVVSFYELTKKTEFNISFQTDIVKNGDKVATIVGEFYLKLLENNEFDARIKFNVIEFADGVKIAWHQLDLSIVSLTTLLTYDASATDAMMYGIYGNNEKDTNAVVKVKSTFTGIINLIEEVMNLLNLDIMSQIGGSLGSNTLFDVNELIEYLNITDSSINLGINANSLFASMLDEHQVLDITLIKDGNTIVGLNASNIYVSYENIFSSMKLDNVMAQILEESLNVYIPESTTDYYDISQISNLVEALYNNAMEKAFEVKGTVTLSALGFVNVDVPVDIKVNVDETGAPTVAITLDLWDISLLATALASRKRVYIYYQNEYVYIIVDEKDDSKIDRKVKIHFDTFMDNAVYYLLDYGLGLSASIIDAINNSDTKGDGFVDAAGCVIKLEFGETRFTIGLDMNELADNGNLGDLVATLSTTLVALTNNDGSYVLDEDEQIVFVPMIYRLDSFSFNMVNVIALKSSDLVLSNIVKDSNGNYIVTDVDMSNDFKTMADFDAEFNADEEYIKNAKTGVWSSNGKVKHKVVFDMGYAGTIVNQYYMDSRIDFPIYTDNVVSVEVDGSIKYYKILGWYYDSSYLNPIEDLNDIYMAQKKLYFYARVVDVTVNLTISSAFAETITLTTYEGANISSLIDQLYNIINIDGTLYMFSGLTTLDGEFYDPTNIISGDVELVANFDVVEMNFYAVYDEEEFELTDSDASTFLNDDVVIYINGIYYLYDCNILTPQFIMTRFASLFDINEELGRFEIRLYNKESFNNLDLITFDVKASYNDKDYKGFYINKNSMADISSLLPNGTTDLYEINAWVFDEYNYLSSNDLTHISGSYNLNSYIATKQEFFSFERTTIDGVEGATIKAFNASNVTVLIFPIFARLGNDCLTILSILEQQDAGSSDKYSAFTGNTTIQTIVFNDGLRVIGSNAFKNCTGLKHIYIPSSVQTIASDAFFFSQGNGTLSGNTYADNLKIHFLYKNDASEVFNYTQNRLLAYKRTFIGTTNYYYDSLKNVIVKENLSCLNIVNSLI